MALPGTAWAERMARFATYLEGDSPDVLVSTADASEVPVVFSDEVDGQTQLGSGAIANGAAAVFTRTRLAVGSTWTYGGHTWTVSDAEVSPSGGGRWPYRATLERHA